jgi:hypothetical protein
MSNDESACLICSVFHLVVNLLVQVLLGIPLEMVHGWWRVLLVYLAGVVAGSLGTSVSDPRVYLAGASGGVYAIIAAHLATMCMVCVVGLWCGFHCKLMKNLSLTIWFLPSAGNSLYCTVYIILLFCLNNYELILKFLSERENTLLGKCRQLRLCTFQRNGSLFFPYGESSLCELCNSMVQGFPCAVEGYSADQDICYITRRIIMITKAHQFGSFCVFSQFISL